MNVSNLGYVGLRVQDTFKWREYATEVLGLMAAEQDSSDERMTFKMDDHPFRLSVEKGTEDKLACAGWELASQADYETAIKNLERAGAKVIQGSEAGAKARCVTQYASTADPAGNPFEIYYGRVGLSDNFKSPAGVERFITGSMGMGHLVIPAPNIEETHNFYKDALGFSDSDDLTLPPPAEGAPEQRILFMHADNPRHHSLALYNYPVPTGIVHLMFEMPDIDHVGACFDRVNAAEIPLMGTLGRHCNDRMLSFYMYAPGGIGVECGCDGLQIDHGNYVPTVSTEADIWGHALFFHEIPRIRSGVQKLGGQKQNGIIETVDQYEWIEQ